ncbi:MAG: glycosyltransferase family 4 protein [Nostoc sp.]
MKVIHMLMHDNTGAGKAAIRLHDGLLQENIDSLVMTSHKSLDSIKILRPNKSKLLYKKMQILIMNKILSGFGVKENIFSINLLPSFVNQDIKFISPDIINLHWIGWEFLQIEELKKINIPLVWTLHDMWAFTGGCHYSGDCNNYISYCGKCPQLQSSQENDISNWVLKRKLKAWQNLNITVVSPSNWLAKCASSSSLFKNVRIEVIPNGIDTKKYQPISQSVARNILGLPQNKQLILFGAIAATSDRRKGFHLLQTALQILSQTNLAESIELVVFGASDSGNSFEISFESHYLGKLNDDFSLALVYAASDVFVAPSLEDNLPNTVMESLACATPCVAFDVGGMGDLIEHQQNGYLAKPFDVEDLAKGITWVLNDQHRSQNLGTYARTTVEQKFSLEKQAKKYLSLYQELSQTI